MLLKLDEGQSRESDPDEEDEEDSDDEEDESSAIYINASNLNVRSFSDLLYDSHEPRSRDEAAVISLTRHEFPAFTNPLGFGKEGN